VVYQSVCNLLLLEMRAKRLYLRPSYLIGLDWIVCIFYVVYRPDHSEAMNGCDAADGSENTTFSASAAAGSHGEHLAGFHRGDTKRTGIRRALTICRTAL